MAVTAVQFIAPVGLIEIDTMFPEEDIDTVTIRINSAITEGTARATDVVPADLDAAIIAWTYYRLWMAVYISLSATPSSAAMADMGSTLYTYQQIQNFKELADMALAEFLGYTDLAGTARQKPRSYSVSHRIAYR